MKKRIVIFLALSLLLPYGCSQTLTEGDILITKVQWDAMDDAVWQNQCKNARELPAKYGNPPLAQVEYFVDNKDNDVSCRIILTPSNKEFNWFTPEKSNKPQIERLTPTVFEQSKVRLCCKLATQQEYDAICKEEVLPAKCDSKGNSI